MKLFDFNFFDQSQAKLLEEIEMALVGGVLLGEVSVASDGLGRVSIDKKLSLTITTSDLKQKPLLTLATPNPEQIVLAQTDKQLTHDLQAFDYLLPDGVGLVWASQIFKFLGKTPTSLERRIPGVDVVVKLLNLANNQNLKVLVVGGRNYQDLKPLLSDKLGLADLQIKWTEGFSNVKHQSKGEQQATVDLIKKLRPDVILVALGAPDQERWIIDNQQLLASQGVRLAMAIGGSLEMLTGRLQRAPSWMRQMGLEWLWRLVQEPWRWRRQLALMKFIQLVVSECF